MRRVQGFHKRRIIAMTPVMRLRLRNQRRTELANFRASTVNQETELQSPVVNQEEELESQSDNKKRSRDIADDEHDDYVKHILLQLSSRLSALENSILQAASTTGDTTPISRVAQATGSAQTPTQMEMTSHQPTFQSSPGSLRETSWQATPIKPVLEHSPFQVQEQSTNLSTGPQQQFMAPFLPIQPLLSLSNHDATRTITQIELKPPFLRSLSTDEIHTFRSAFEAYTSYTKQRGVAELNIAALIDTGILNYIFLCVGSVENVEVFKFLDNELHNVKPNANLSIGLRSIKWVTTDSLRTSLTRFWICTAQALSQNGYHSVIHERDFRGKLFKFLLKQMPDNLSKLITQEVNSKFQGHPTVSDKKN
jgi:hypothetical protein